MPKKGESIKLIPKIPYVILCEGRDEELFLRCYVSHLVEGKVAPDTFNIINLGGNEELQKKLRVLHSVEYYDHMQGFSDYTRCPKPVLSMRPDPFKRV